MPVSVSKCSDGRGYKQSVIYTHEELKRDLPDEALKALRDVPGHDTARYYVTDCGKLSCFVEWLHGSVWFVFSENDAQWTERKSWELSEA